MALVEDLETGEGSKGYSKEKELEEKRRRGRKYWDARKEDLGSEDEEK